MSAKKFDLDNRETKVPLVQRFMNNPLNKDSPKDKESESDEPKKEQAEVKEEEKEKEELIPDISSIIPNPQNEMDKIKERHVAISGEEQTEIINKLKEQIKIEIMREISAKTAAEPPPPEKPSAADVPKVNIDTPVQKEENEHYIFRNTMEDIVLAEVKSILKYEKKMCKCNHCFSDICAIALNSIKPHYVTTEIAALFDRASLLDISKLNKISVEIFKAVEIVKKSPSHT